MKKIKIQTGFRLSERDKQLLSQKIVYTNLKNNLHINTVPFVVNSEISLSQILILKLIFGIFDFKFLNFLKNAKPRFTIKMEL